MRARNLHRPVASHSDTRIGDALGEPQELAGYSRSNRQLGFQRVEGPQPPKYLRNLRCRP